MKIINKIKGWISSSPEEVRGVNDSVQDLLSIRVPAGRVRFLYFIIVLSFLILIGRLAYLQLGFNTDFLQKQGEMRFQRTLDVSAVRGRILDRNGAFWPPAFQEKVCGLFRRTPILRRNS